MDLEQYQPELSAIFEQHKVMLAYLFGSQATGLAGPLSDVDFAVVLDDQVPRSAHTDLQLDLIAELAGMLKRNDVDVVILNHAPPLLAYRVAQQGKILYLSSDRMRVAFEVKALRDYTDTIPLRRIQHFYLAKRIEARRSSRANVKESS